MISQLEALRQWKRQKDDLDALRDQLILDAIAAGATALQVAGTGAASVPTVNKVTAAAAPVPESITWRARKALGKAGFREITHYWTAPEKSNPEVVVLHWVPDEDDTPGTRLRHTQKAVEVLLEAGIWAAQPETIWSADMPGRMADGKPVWLRLTEPEPRPRRDTGADAASPQSERKDR